MPNWCSNDLIIRGPKDALEGMLHQVKSSESNFDFNRIVEMPEELNISSGSPASIYYELKYGTEADLNKILDYPWMKEGKATTREEALKVLNMAHAGQWDEVVKLGEQYHTNMEKYGHTTWYEWRYQYWGTKWNADDVTEITVYDKPDESSAELSFNTAWGPPLPIIEKLAEQYPTLYFDLHYYEGGMGFQGHFTWDNGNPVENWQGDYDGERGG